MNGSVFSYQTKTEGQRWGFVYDLPASDGTGQRRQQKKRGFVRKREAEKALREVLSQADSGVFIERSAVTVASYLQQEWLPRKKPMTGETDGRRSRGRLGISTWQAYADYVRSYVVPTIGGVRLQDLTARHVNHAYDELARAGGRSGKGLAPKTLANLHGVLHKALSDAVRDGLVPRNVVDLVDAPTAPKPRTQVWDLDQLRRFIQHVRGDEFEALWIIFATTGLRRGEALGLCWSDIDLDAGLATVERTLGEVRGKPVWKPRPKSESSVRTLALDPSTVRALREHRQRQNEHRLMLGPAWPEAPADDSGVRHAGVVFTWQDGRLISPQRISKWFGRHVEEAGLPPIRLHDLRHSYATAALRTTQGWHEVKTLSRRLGHATVGMTLDTYSHALPADDRAQADTLARLLLAD